MIRAPLTVLLTLLALGPASAQPPATWSDDVVEGDLEHTYAQATQQALAHVKAGRLEEAIAVLEPLRSEPELPPRVLAILGGLYAESGRQAEALEVLEPLCQSEDADPAVLYNAGQAALALGRTEDAEGYLERSVERAPESPAARALGILRSQQKRYVDALILLRPWVRQNLDDTEARLAAAQAALRLERAPDAEELLSDLPQTNPRVRLLWGKLLILQGDPRGAIATLKPLVESAPQDVELDVRRTLADAQAAVGEQETQMSSLEREESLRDPTGWQIRKGFDLIDAGDAEAALKVARREARLAPEDPRPLLLEASALLRLNRPEEAVAGAEQALALAPENPDALYLRGTTRMAVRNVEGAEEDLRRTLELAPDHTAAMNDLAVLLMDKGELEEARRLLQRVLERHPDDAVAKANLKRLDTP